MTDAETVACLRTWKRADRGPFSWPTDPCGYEQHIRFVSWRHCKWDSAIAEGKTFDQFVQEYADALERGEVPPFKRSGE